MLAGCCLRPRWLPSSLAINIMSARGSSGGGTSRENPAHARVAVSTVVMDPYTRWVKSSRVATCHRTTVLFALASSNNHVRPLREPTLARGRPEALIPGYKPTPPKKPAPHIPFPDGGEPTCTTVQNRFGAQYWLGLTEQSVHSVATRGRTP